MKTTERYDIVFMDLPDDNVDCKEMAEAWHHYATVASNTDGYYISAVICSEVIACSVPTRNVTDPHRTAFLLPVPESHTSSLQANIPKTLLSIINAMVRDLKIHVYTIQQTDAYFSYFLHSTSQLMSKWDGGFSKILRPKMKGAHLLAAFVLLRKKADE